MATNDIRARVIAAARGEVGYRRKSSRWNKYADQVYPTVQYQAYCGVFIGWAIKQAGVDARGVVWLPFVPYIENWARKNGAWKTSGQKAGDLVVFGFGRSSGQHVGFAWPDPDASGYRSIEGNTSSTSAGSQANGGAVAVRYRGRSSIRGWVDLEKLVKAAGYKADAKPSTPVKQDVSGKLDEDGRFDARTAQELQQRLRTRDLDLSVDGKFGPDSFRALQSYVGADYIDGEISRQPEGAKDLGDGYRKDCVSVGAGKSDFVERWQAYVGATVDGRLGEATIKRTQHQLNISEKSFTKEHDTTVDLRVKNAKLA